MNVLYQIAKPFQEIFQDQFFIENISIPRIFLFSIMTLLNISLDFIVSIK